MRKIKVCFLSFPFCKRKGDFESAKDVHFYFYRLEQRHFGAETDFCKTIAGSDQPSLSILCSKKYFFLPTLGLQQRNINRIVQNDNSSYSPFSFWQEKETFNARLGSWSSFWEGNSLLVKISFFFFAKRETFLFNPRLRACSSLLSFGAGQPESARTMPSPPSSAESQK